MLKNYFKTAFRNLVRQKGYAAINIIGLAVGVTCFLLISMYVAHEYNYDKYNENFDRIFRVMVYEEQVNTPTIIAPLLKREFPEILETARLYPLGSYAPIIVRQGQTSFEERNFFYADSTVFKIFSFKMIAGEPSRALTRPKTIVLTQEMAQKYFGDINPIGKVLNIEASEDYEVTGVIENIPSNSHLKIDFLASFNSTHWAFEEIWSSANFYAYALLPPEYKAEEFNRKLEGYVANLKAQNPGMLSKTFDIWLMPLADIHLYQQQAMQRILVLSGIALLILVIACINYMNLATAKAARRSREVGIRKTVGAHRLQLTVQFLGESLILTSLAIIVALILVEFSQSMFNKISGITLSLVDLVSWKSASFFVFFVFFVSFMAGCYPAFVLSSFNPMLSLKSRAQLGGRADFLRRGLVVLQFAISVILIASTTIIYAQLDYVTNSDLGFSREQVVVLPIRDKILREKYPLLKQEILRIPTVRSASAVNSYPGYQRAGYALEAEGLTMPAGEYFLIRGMQADKDFVETLGLQLIAGPGFPKTENQGERQDYVYLINETTAKALNWTPAEAIGKRFNLLGNRQGQVVGVVRDFHHASLHESIDPLAIFMEAGSYNYLLVKVGAAGMKTTLADLNAVWQQHASHRPFEYRFLDSEFAALYEQDQRLSKIVSLFAVLAILIACLGLFGLAAYAAEKRTKEIGVRKVLGASVGSVVSLLSKDFLKLVLIGTCLACPFAWYVMSRWLQSFAYRLEIGWWVFFVAGGVALVIALLTVSMQATRAALANPVDSLRYE